MTDFILFDDKTYPLVAPEDFEAARAAMRGRVDHMPIWESSRSPEELSESGPEPLARATGRQLHVRQDAGKP